METGTSNVVMKITSELQVQISVGYFFMERVDEAVFSALKEQRMQGMKP